MKSKRLIALLGLCLLIGTAGGCKRGNDAKDSRSTSPLVGKAAGCNLLLITLDTTRADRLGCYGHRQAATPALDGLAERGVRFAQAFAQAPITLPSHASLLTGLYPAEHGLRVNGKGKLASDIPTVAQAFQRRGYATGAFLAAAPLDSRHGLDLGFDVYDDDIPRRPDGAAEPYRPGNAVRLAAMEWLQQVRSRPFMCWVHFYDPHTPYSAPPQFAMKASDLYDAEVAFMDAQIAELLEWLRRNELTARTLVVVVGDHGESLGEHGYKWHSLLLYDSILHVPLILSLPGGLPEGESRQALVRMVDVFPTVLDLMGWDDAPSTSGVSLTGILGGNEAEPLAAYAETDYGFNAFGWARVRCIVADRWKYIRAPTAELYDRIADPGELVNLAASHPDVADRMERRLANLEAGMTEREAAPAELDAETARALKSLGYVSGPTQTAVSSAERRDPKDLVDLVHDYRAAETDLASGRPQNAIALLEPAVRRSPESFVLVEMLGKALALAGKLDEGQEQLERALELNPESADSHLGLARILLAQESLAEARPHLQAALKLSPGDPEANVLLGAIALEKGREQKAAERFQAAEESAPGDPRVYQWWAKLLAVEHPGRAAEKLQKGLRYSPANDALALQLARLRLYSTDEDVRDAAAAIDLSREVCRRQGYRSPQSLCLLAQAYSTAGRCSDAVRIARMALPLARSARRDSLEAELQAIVAECGNDAHLNSAG